MSCWRPGFVAVGSAAFLFGGYNYGKLRQRALVQEHLRQAEAARQAELKAKDLEIARLSARVAALAPPKPVVKSEAPAAAPVSDDPMEAWFATAHDVAAKK